LLLSQMQLFCNDVSVEMNNYYGLWSVVKNYLSKDESFVKTWGAQNLYNAKSLKEFDTVTAAYFTGDAVPFKRKLVMTRVKNVMHLMIPLELDIASSGKYLLDNVAVRIRFDLNPASFVLLSDNGEFNYKIMQSKLHVEKILPNPASLVSLNKSMRIDNSMMDYIIDRAVVKSIVFPAGYMSLNIENLFQGVVPTKLIVFIVSQVALAGDFKRNPLYLHHCNINNKR